MSQGHIPPPEHPDTNAAPPDWLTDPSGFEATPADPLTIADHHLPWIRLTDSMTAALGRHFEAEPKVCVHYSGPCNLLPWEQQMICPTAQTGIQGYARQISLVVETKRVLAARSVTALDSPLQPLLSELQTTPLARILFEDPKWQRDGEPTPLTCGSHTGRAGIWMDDRSGQRLIVEEFFLF